MPNFIITNTIPKYNSDDLLVANIDGKKCKTLEKFFISIAQELKFPEYFGHNLDAFDEMICDLSWLEEEAVIIILKNFEELLDEEETDEEDFKGLIMSLLDSAADDQKSETEGTPIRIIIKNEKGIKEYLNENGIEYIHI